VLLLEKVDGMAYAAVGAALAAGVESEEVSVFAAREDFLRFMDTEPLLSVQASKTPEERDLREAVGVSL
jgi:hypothetical protein